MPDRGDRPPKPPRPPQPEGVVGNPTVQIGEVLAIRSHVALMCKRCGHSVTADLSGIGRHISFDLTLADLARRCRCSKCRTRGETRVWISR